MRLNCCVSSLPLISLDRTITVSTVPSASLVKNPTSVVADTVVVLSVVDVVVVAGTAKLLLLVTYVTSSPNGWWWWWWWWMVLALVVPDWSKISIVVPLFVSMITVSFDSEPAPPVSVGAVEKSDTETIIAFS